MLLKILAAVVFLAFAILIIYPWRLESRRQWQEHDLDQAIARDDYLARREVTATQKLPDSDARKLKALQHLADCYWQENKLEAAEKILADLWVSHDRHQKPGYDADFVDVMLMTAGVHRDQGKEDTAQANYEQIYFYDMHHNDSDMTKHIARDLNNLGVAYYMVGLSNPKQVDGMVFYQKSIDYFEAALKSYRELYGDGSQYEANALYNESLPLRDIGRRERAEEARAQSRAIMASVKRPCELP
jgi:tetratricopeptide (TPR) repeat protein